MTDKTPHPRSVAGFMARNGISRTTVYAEIKRGNLQVTKVGTRTLITEPQEQAWLGRLSNKLCPARGKKSA